MKKDASILNYAFILGLALLFSYSCEKDDPKSVAQLTTTVVTEITPTSSVSGGEIANDGGANVTARGVCWSKNQTPTINDSKTSNGTGIGSFTSSITSLEPNTTYYVRAYASNSEGTSYGSTISFKTLEAIKLPSLTTTETTEITQSTAISGGDITDDGGAPITARGVCWSTNETPTISDNKTENGTNKGKFTSNITDLTPKTTYFIRAYATNSKGTNYGNEISFKTLDLPTLSTTKVTEITQTTAISGGNITDDGGAAVTARGVCWSTNEMPTIKDDKTEDGTDTGSYISNITDLEPNTTYHVRAYATNSEGTAYGNAISFSTQFAVVDIDGNNYPIVTIGTQTWMAENLKTTHYPNGDGIPLVTDNSAWANLDDNNTDDAYCYFNNNANDEANIYGALYTYAAAIKVCPNGWHLPTNAEWDELNNYLDIDIDCKLAGNATLWNSGKLVQNINFGKSGFTAIPSGNRGHNYGTFHNIGKSGYWWSATDFDDSSSSYRYVYYDIIAESSIYANKSQGFSVRCIRD